MCLLFFFFLRFFFEFRNTTNIFDLAWRVLQLQSECFEMKCSKKTANRINVMTNEINETWIVLKPIIHEI